MQAAPAILCLLAPLRQSATDHIPEALSSTHQGGAGPAPYCISKLPCLHLSIHAATHTIIITYYPIAIGSMQTYWLSGKLKGSADLLPSPQNGPPPGP
eukprot:1147855-Pelagomonas_calceolata.AAC.1